MVSTPLPAAVMPDFVECYVLKVKINIVLAKKK
jgi:hypothetical protein